MYAMNALDGCVDEYMNWEIHVQIGTGESHNFAGFDEVWRRLDIGERKKGLINRFTAGSRSYVILSYHIILTFDVIR